ncbi:hypothetical protein [uncultured Nitratireductor sp.]|uniref:hypothetical protein n=1 Tax=uncultured Nitratireductor sp. TaxID=520953 RepID=UPI00262396B0|nr:hypothetical protein [uncultured Nitratireductor sp.]
MIIDIWDTQSYDEPLLELLHENQKVIYGYFEEEKKIDDESSRKKTWSPPRSNPFVHGYHDIQEKISALMQDRTIRVFHYTRMTDAEVDRFMGDGIIPTSLEFLEVRINRVVQEELITAEQGKEIFKRSPLHSPALYGVRKGFWTTTGAFHPTDPGVNLLLEHWGGESAYWCITGENDDELTDTLRNLGRGRIFEIHLPVADANHGNANTSLGAPIVREYARTLGFDIYPEARDITIYEPAPPSVIIRHHNEGDEKYDHFGRGYPERHDPPM